jgi:hypothetical protein
MQEIAETAGWGCDSEACYVTSLTRDVSCLSYTSIYCKSAGARKLKAKDSRLRGNDERE